MDSIIFGPDLALGIPEMDQSHRAIFELLGSMLLLTRPLFDVVCHRLASEIASDLAMEDKLMQAIDYAPASVHRAAHDSLLAAVVHAQYQLASGDEAGARQTISTIPDWVEAHINTMDLALAIAVTRSQ